MPLPFHSFLLSLPFPFFFFALLSSASHVFFHTTILVLLPTTTLQSTLLSTSTKRYVQKQQQLQAAFSTPQKHHSRLLLSAAATPPWALSHSLPVESPGCCPRACIALNSRDSSCLGLTLGSRASECSKNTPRGHLTLLEWPLGIPTSPIPVRVVRRTNSASLGALLPFPLTLPHCLP